MSGGMEEMRDWEEAEKLRWHNETDRSKSTWNAVLNDITKREQMGVLRYGKYLTPHTTEDTLQHLYEELLDAVVYIKTEILKRDREKEVNDTLPLDVGYNANTY